MSVFIHVYVDVLAGVTCACVCLNREREREEEEDRERKRARDVASRGPFSLVAHTHGGIE